MIPSTFDIFLFERFLYQVSKTKNKGTKNLKVYYNKHC